MEKGVQDLLESIKNDPRVHTNYLSLIKIYRSGENLEELRLLRDQYRNVLPLSLGIFYHYL